MVFQQPVYSEFHNCKRPKCVVCGKLLSDFAITRIRFRKRANQPIPNICGICLSHGKNPDVKS